MKEPLTLKLIGGGEKQVLKKTYTNRELNAFVEGKIIISDLDKDSRVIKTKKLAKITDMIFYLNELDNSDNLEDGRSSNVLITYHVTADKYFRDFAHFEPTTPQYKKLKNGEIVSLMLRITDQNGHIITNESGTTVVLHICDCRS